MQRCLKISSVVGIALTLVTAAVSRAEIAEPEPPPPPKPVLYTVAGMHAFLFLRESGKWHSEDLFTAPGLWNTGIGEGLAGEPASSASLIVQLNGQTFGRMTGKLDVVATQGKRNLLKQTVRVLDLFSPKQDVSVPFLLNSLGCGEVVVTATLRIPGRPVSTMTKKINFACGE
jgi:hypothetical protein